jgi:hypothetical protein
MGKLNSDTRINLWRNEPMKKKSGKLKYFLIGIAVIFVIGIIANMGDDDAGTTPETNNTKTTVDDAQITSTPTEEATSAPTAEPTEVVLQAEPYEVKLTAGHYVAGIDFPSGIYNLEAESGSGNVNLSNMYQGGLNEVMGKEDNGLNVPSFKNAKLEDGIILSIGGDLMLGLKSDAANVSEIKPRINGLTETVTLTSGNYTAGTDFDAGTYDIIATEGSGNVSSSNMFEGGLNEIMGTDNDGFSIKKFKNATFEEGVELTVSNVTIQLVPSKSE